MLLPIVEVFMMAGTDPAFGIFQRTAEFLTCTPSVGKFSVFSHGKTRLTDRVPLWEQLRILGIPFI